MVILLVVTVPAAAFGTPAAQQGGNFLVSVAGTAVGSIPHQIDLKVTQLPGGQLTEVSVFAVSPEDVVSGSSSTMRIRFAYSYSFSS